MVSNGRPELLEKSFQLDHLEEVKVVSGKSMTYLPVVLMALRAAGGFSSRFSLLASLNSHGNFGPWSPSHLPRLRPPPDKSPH